MSGIVKPPFGTQLYLDHPLARGLVGAWLMNEGSGKYVHDYSGQGNEGTIIGMNDPPIVTSGWNAGPHGGALAFDAGQTDYVEIEKGFNDTIFYIIFWVKPNSITVDQYIFGHSEDKRTVILGSTDNYFNVYHAGYPTGNPDDTKILATEQDWQQIVYGSHGGRIYGYKNGELVINVAGNLNTSGLTKSFIGNNYIPTSTVKFYGLISKVSIYNRALSAEEIAYLYAFPYCMFEPSLPLLWLLSSARRAAVQQQYMQQFGQSYMNG